MAVTANSIITPQTPRSNAVGVATANTTFTTSPTNTALLVTFGANGGRLTRLSATPLENVTANNLQAYRDVGTAGVSKYLFAAVTGGSDTVSGADGPATLDFGYSDDNPLIGQPNERIYVATGIAKAYNFIAEWADY
ncbi:hypothetical protein [uncultured Phenylobacterium sp.]|uniref:hypothetical protein n=1 Tax=uncultured Phenylobacterium sp. TaxID=349273 RepID=UPI0025EC8672|nr:hypothetical protein [uncultured Phenylobacterium sp.]